MNQRDHMQSDTVFSGSISKVYETFLVPLIFQPYADDLTQRLSMYVEGERLQDSTAERTMRVLEVAAGTGVVTRAMSRALPSSVEIVATDLNQAMINEAVQVGVSRPVEWRQADVMQLPFDDQSFDAVVCQFGVMFFPDKAKAFAEMRRVLRPGGLLLFNVWDRIQDNAFAAEVTDALSDMSADNSAQFMARTPHGYFDRTRIENDLRAGGFTEQVDVHTVTCESRASSAREVAIAFCQGTPLRNEIEARGDGALAEATDVAARAIAARFGSGDVKGKIQALVIAVQCE